MMEPEEEEKKDSELKAQAEVEQILNQLEVQQTTTANIEMTDEEGDEEEYERRMMMEELERRRRRSDSSNDDQPVSRIEGVMLNAPEAPKCKEAINEDLEQLIKANGDDIEFEFFIMGETVRPNQTIYEIMR